jgi:hypothetical protein
MVSKRLTSINETYAAKNLETPVNNRTNEGDQRFTLWMGVVLVGIIFFLSADQLLGAVYLRSFYVAIGVLIGFSLILILVVLSLWKHVLRETLIGWSLVGLVIALCATTTSPYTSLIGWLALIFLGASFDNFPFVLGAYLVIGMVVSIICFRLEAILPAKLVRSSMLLLVAFYSFSVAAKANSQATSYTTSVSFNNQFYVAYLTSWGPSSPDHLTLYECNQFALLCQTIYEKSDWFYTYEGSNNMEFIPDLASDTISLRIDNEVIYTHRNIIETEQHAQ